MKVLNYQIPNWEKYQHNNTQKFIRLDNDHLLDPKVQQLSAQQYRVWLTLLCTSGRQVNDGKGSILFSTLHSLSKNRGSNLQVTIDKLSELGLIEIQKERKERYIKGNEKSKSKKEFLTDEMVDEFYSSYPRKVGKVSGNAKLKKIIKNETDLENFKKALENYLNLCQKEKTEMKFIKNWSTFVNQHLDFLEIDISPPRKKKNSFLEQFEKGGTDV